MQAESAVTESEVRLNPYAPSMLDSDEETPSSEPASEEAPSSMPLHRTGFRWLVVCTLSALPSFFWGMAITEGQIAGMVCGILVFVVGYTLLDQRTASRPFRQKATVRRTLKIAYGTRIAISILFPIGAYLDLFCGFISLSLTQHIAIAEFTTADSMQFGGTFLTTLVQGAVLNVVLGCYALLVHGIQLLVRSLRR